MLRGEEMAAGDIADINQIEAGVHIGRHFALQEIDDNFSCWCGFDIPWANGGGRIDNDDRQALLTEPESGLLRQDFAALVVANGVLWGQMHGLIPRRAVVWDTNRGHAARIDNLLYPQFECDLQQIGRALHIGGIHGVGMRGPEAIVGGYVVEGVTPLQCRPQRGHVPHIAVGHLDR